MMWFISSISRTVGVALAALAFATLPARAAEKLSVLLDFAPWGMHAGFHLAQQKGWFANEGLEVILTDGRGSVSTIQLVGAGQADVGMAQLGSMAAARQAGSLSIKSFAGIVRKGDLAALVDSRSNINTVKDLEGKKLTLFAASPWVPFIDMFFQAGGLAKDKVSLLYVDPAAMVSTYTSGQADGVMTAGPYGQAVAEPVRPTKLILAADYGIAFPSYGLFATEETLKAKAEVLRKLMRVQQQAWAYILDGHLDEGVAAIVSQRPNAKLDPKILKRQIELYLSFLDTPETKGKPFGWQSEKDWADAVTTMQKAGLLKPEAKPSDFYTNDFVSQ
jgi:NitT/TauT family transport system substrate-binding protein